MKKTIEKQVITAITRLQKDAIWSDFSVPKIMVERPKDTSHGDWTTNVAFVLAKELKMAPGILATQLADAINNVSDVDITAQAIQSGYINFTLSRESVCAALKKIDVQKESYGANNLLLGQKIMVEYTQPNPFKPFHIGHLMSNTIGESISRIVEFSGADVIRVNYQGDVGPHVAKALWAIQKFNYDITDIDEIGKAYAKGHAAYESNDTVKKEIQAINKAIYTCSDTQLMQLYAVGRDKTLERFEEIYKMLGTRFDVYYFESQTWRRGEEIVREHIGDIFEKSDGAIIFDGEKYDLHKRVFITTQGLPTYEAKELGLALLKKDTHPSDIYMITTAVEQEEYFKVVKKVIELVDESFKGKIQHIAHGMMQLTSGKMSSRSGNVITGESLIAQAQEVAAAKMSERAHADTADEIVNMIAIAGIKFSILKQRAGKNIAYDADAALSFDGDSGPYVQYTYARCQSVLAKAQENNIIGSFDKSKGDAIALERLLIQFGDVVEYAVKERAPHQIANYVIECARAFNAYYAKNAIVDNADLVTSTYRVALTTAVAQVMKNGLFLLGIEAPQKM